MPSEHQLLVSSFGAERSTAAARGFHQGRLSLERAERALCRMIRHRLGLISDRISI